jgi:hypothetical protein
MFAGRSSPRRIFGSDIPDFAASRTSGRMTFMGTANVAEAG